MSEHDFKHLDFSEFHDLMHPPFSRYCRGMPGGPWRHVTLWWTYRAWPEVRRYSVCKVGIHRWSLGTQRKDDGDVRFVACQDCVKRGRRRA